MYVPMLSGCAAGWSFWFANYPLDFIKTKMQSSAGDSFATIARRTYAAGGVKAFYRGFSVCLLRSLPANASVWYGVEVTSQWMKDNGM